MPRKDAMDASDVLNKHFLIPLSVSTQFITDTVTSSQHEVHESTCCTPCRKLHFFKVHNLLRLPRNLHLKASRSTKRCTCPKYALQGSQSAAPATKSAPQGPQSAAPAPKSALQGSQSVAPATKSALQGPQRTAPPRNLHINIHIAQPKGDSQQQRFQRQHQDAKTNQQWGRRQGTVSH